MSEMIDYVGKILDKPIPRDAFHVAAMSVQVGQYYLEPGQPVKFKKGSYTEVVRANDKDAIGIIDPYLNIGDRFGGVEQGNWVLMFLLPKKVTGMRHHWEHPEIPSIPENMPPVSVSESEQWLMNFADKWGFEYQEMIDGANSGSYITAHGKDIHSSSELDYGDEELFWKHVEQVLGKKFDKEHRDNTSWSCSC